METYGLEQLGIVNAAAVYRKGQGEPPHGKREIRRHFRQGHGVSPE